MSVTAIVSSRLTFLRLSWASFAWGGFFLPSTNNPLSTVRVLLLRLRHSVASQVGTSEPRPLTEKAR